MKLEFSSTISSYVMFQPKENSPFSLWLCVFSFPMVIILTLLVLAYIQTVRFLFWFLTVLLWEWGTWKASLLVED